MKYLLLIWCLTFFVHNSKGQNNSDMQEITLEGRKLYQLEMASWLGKDIFLKKTGKTEDSKDCLTYKDKGMLKCIFFSNYKTSGVYATIVLDSNFKEIKSGTGYTVRAFTHYEQDIFYLYQESKKLLTDDTLFKSYGESKFRIIPLIDGNSKKVFILTETEKDNDVLFGNDFLLEFDKNNKIIGKKQLHKNLTEIIFTTHGKAKNGDGIETMHKHENEYDNIITSTDVCTLLLYQDLAGWSSHLVISEKAISIWSAKSNSFTVVKKDVLKNMHPNARRKKL